jgi:hypothetical protein
MQNLEVKLNPDVYLANLNQQVANSLAGLRNTLRSIDDGTFVNRASEPRPQSVVHFRIDNVHADQDSVHKACASAFLDIVRALITFIDRIVAVRRCVGKSFQVPDTVTNLVELQAFMEKQLEDTYSTVARDTKLTNPAKFKSLGVPSPAIEKAVLSYFALRRTIEHHNGVPEQDTGLWYWKSTIFCGQEEITAVPFVAKEAAQVSIKIETVERVFPAGQKIDLTESDIEQIFFTIQSVVGPEIRKTVFSS